MSSRAPRFATCFVLVACADFMLKLAGFARCMRFARRVAQLAPVAAGRGVVDATMYRIAVATAFYPGRSRCLEQALVAFVLLRRRGVDARLRMGVQPYPFYAHAWVEVNGVALNETAELIAGLAPMPEVAL